MSDLRCATGYSRGAYGFVEEQGYMRDPISFSLMHCQAWYHEFDPIMGASVKANNDAVVKFTGEDGEGGGWG